MNEKGQAMIETAFVIALLVLLIFGMTEFGRAMYTKNTLNNAARAGARVAVVTSSASFPNPLPNAATLSCPSNANPIYTAICNNIVAGIQGTKKVSIEITAPNGSSKTTPATGDQIRVSVQADFIPVLDLMKGMIREQLTGEATMRYE